jgi:hypothetical protein
VNFWKFAPCSRDYPEAELRGQLHGAGRVTMIDPIGEAARVGA